MPSPLFKEVFNQRKYFIPNSNYKVTFFKILTPSPISSKSRTSRILSIELAPNISSCHKINKVQQVTLTYPWSYLCFSVLFPGEILEGALSLIFYGFCYFQNYQLSNTVYNTYFRFWDYLVEWKNKNVKSAKELWWTF